MNMQYSTHHVRRRSAVVMLGVLLLALPAAGALGQDSGDELPAIKDQPLQAEEFEEDRSGNPIFEFTFKSGMAEIDAGGEVGFTLSRNEVDGNPLEMDSPYSRQAVVSFAVPAEQGVHEGFFLQVIIVGVGVAKGATEDTKIEITSINEEENTISARLIADFREQQFGGNLNGTFTVPYEDNR